ncbi:uncharacterized protein [Elaeis guineensis]|uniref:Alkyl transferase n=1 Tax=Elaeis guineensis var. tenera TaxID=51953 RepID=A0A6I9QL82_ELAGV|nr:dehydrodolichyl diphosphate synthase 2 [Elaeis guineensis]
MCTIDTICYQWQANPLHIPFCAINPTQSLSSSRHHSNFPLQVIEMAKIYNEREEKGEKESARNGGNGVEQLPSSLRWELLPKHVAVIMDGNSRWARMKGLPTWAGHEAGYRSLEEMVKLSCRWGIQVLTVYAFSFENWHRPKVEVDFLMMMIEGCLKENIECFLSEGIRLRIIGDSSSFPNSLQEVAKEAQEKTKTNSRLEFNIAISYSGRRDITQACQKIAWKVQHGLLDSADITESLIEQELETNYSTKFPCPDLLIRTSGEQRLSNFLLWQSAYTELFFTKTLWPDFGEPEYIEALCSFQQRERRFGQRIVSE